MSGSKEELNTRHFLLFLRILIDVETKKRPIVANSLLNYGKILKNTYTILDFSNLFNQKL